MTEKYILAQEINDNANYPPGSVGYLIKFNPEKLIPLLDYALRTENFFEEDSPFFKEEIEELNPDDVLRELGFYDSSDKRSCINRKKR